MKLTNSAGRASLFNVRQSNNMSGPGATFLRLAVFVAIVGLLASSFYFTSSAAHSNNPAKIRKPADSTRNLAGQAKLVGSPSVGTVDSSLLAGVPAFSPLLPMLQGPVESVATYAADCTTPKTAFNLGDVVCARATGVPSSLFPWRVLWLDPAGFVRQSATAVADEQTTYQFTLPTSPTSLIDGKTVDNRGTWLLNLTKANGARRQSAAFTVHEPANPVADVFVQKIARNESTVPTSGSIAFLLIAANGGPDTGQDVHFVDNLPSGATLVSFSQESGPACLPANTPDCTISSLTNGERAEFTAIYQVGATAGTATTTANISSTTTDSNSANNNYSTEFEITAGGTPSNCSLICPTGLTFTEDPGTGGHTVSANDFPDPVTTGTCGSVSMSVSPNPQNNYFFPLGVSVITVSTESGETCAFTVTVTDDQNPTISCPADITTFESSPNSGSAVVNYSVTGNDNSGSVTIECSQPSGSVFPVGTTQVSCTATDSSNNTATCDFDVTVTSVNSECVLTTQSPIVVDSPADACGAVVTYSTPTAEAGSSCGTVTCDRPSGSFFPVGETLVTCTSSPDGGSTSFTVTVNDVTPPVPTLSTLPTLTETCSVTAGVPTTVNTPSGPITVIEPPTASDNCGGLISASTNDQRTYDVAGTYTVTWTYTDVGGNSVDQVQTVVVSGNDNQAPVPDVASLPVVTDECEVTVVTPPTATDNCSGTVTGTTTDPLTYTGAGTYTVHWTYTDAVGNTSTQNQTVVVTDTHPPTIALVGPSSVTVECHTSFNDPGVTTEDNCVPKNVNVTITGLPNVDLPGTYTVTYTATDGGGNQASVQRTVIVQDTIKPVITLNGGDMTVECHTSFADPGASASDTCDTNVPVIVSGTVDINTPGTYTLTYDAADDSGNAAISVQRVVTVVDTTPPTISCPPSITIEPTCPSGAVGNYTLPTGVDSCAATVNITRTGGPASGSIFPIGTTQVTHSATDPSGNSASCSFTITVLTPQAVLQNLRNSVNASSLTGPQKNGLLSKLDAAINAINNGQTNVACPKLNDFINSVGNLISHGDISAAQGNGWINSANNVRNTIGCTNNPCS